MVSQEVVLFAGTIKENIAYGCLQPPSDEQIESAAKQANVHSKLLVPFHTHTYTRTRTHPHTLSLHMCSYILLLLFLLRNRFHHHLFEGIRHRSGRERNQSLHRPNP